MKSSEIRQRFLKFFEKRGHVIIPSASLIPENDPSVLFNTAGMQPLVPYLLGEKHPAGNRIVNVQKCVRTTDIDEVGDNTHLTFFEMLGNWSLGDPNSDDGIGRASYFKEEAIQWSYEFLTDKEEGLGLDPSRLYITVFEGNEDSPKDEESFEIWKKYIPENRIYFMSAKSNWWSPGENGPCGPDSEMFYDITENGLGDLTKEEFIKADDEQKVIEVWNDVFMGYEKKDGKVIGELAQKNIDTGAGLERLAVVTQGKANVYNTDLFTSIIDEINSKLQITNHKQIQDSNDQNTKSVRIVADHIRTAVFMISDGVFPSNTDAGYILRRIIRRAMRYQKILKLDIYDLSEFIPLIINSYKEIYPELEKNKNKIIKVFREERGKFTKTIHNGDKELYKLFEKARDENRSITGIDMFKMFSTYGYPIEVSFESLDISFSKIDIDKDIYDKEKIKLEFNQEMKKHQELSRTASAGKFKGGLGGDDENSTKLHTATHLLLGALREILGEEIYQKGSNITSERLRFDFNYPEKLSEEQLKKVEYLVNQKIQENIPVEMLEMSKEEALKISKTSFDPEKYSDTVKVYKIGDFSVELCGGPHVKNTNELGKFKIKKEEASSAGIRRIKAVLE